MTTTRVKAAGPLLWLAVGLSAAGCGGDDGLGRRYPVSGTVTYKGAPLAAGNIQFTPADSKGRAASGVVEGGRYSLTTHDHNDGALVGRYTVSVTAKDADPSKVTLELPRGGSMTEAQKKRFTAENPQLAALQANKKAKDLIPPKYGSPATSGLTREVKAESNTIDIELKDE